ncbi:aminopeptidase N [Musca vetustissima]|uniref:aminopeptidase N n=1 Tax=Musca vetustissima TaxID=27455 RepID=UPI002AB66E3C|nr:aminopeptidase N [Musca vetustissima]
MLRDLTYTLDTRRHFLIIHGQEYYQIFEVGKKYRLEILYDGTMNEDHLGLYWLAYRDAGNQVIYQAATQFEPTSARLALPCYDEPAFKANFTIRITHSNKYSAISNMPMKEVIHHNDSDLSTTIFYPTPPISTYLVAFVVSNFGYISKRQGHVTQRVFTPTMSKNKGEHQLEFAIRTVAAIEEYLGVDYSLDKLDHVALNKNYGAAMENWGLITYREDFLLYTENDLRHRFRDTITIVHEIVHQWFGNLVSPEWWSYAWLNEGFATYFSHVIINLLHPEFKPLEYFIMDTAYRAYSYHKYSARWRAMTHYVEEEKEIVDIFDLIGYQKAACVIKMFHHAFGQQTFLRGIQQYLRKYQYSVANEMDLFGCLQNALEQDEASAGKTWVPLVPEIMYSWTHSKQVPIIKVIRNYENNTITLVQQQRSPYAENLWIPLNFASKSDHDFENTAADYFMPPVAKQELNVSQLGIQLEPNDWLIVNKQQSGFYHVLYDDENLRRIAKALQDNHLDIHPINRADIFYCLQPLLDHNEVENVDVIFELLSYLSHEEDLLVWNFVQATVELFERHLDNTASHEHYKQFVRYLVRPIYLKYFPSIHEARQALSEKTGSEHTSRQNLLKMACHVDLTECLDYARQLAFDYIFEQIAFVSSKEDYYVVTGDVLCYGLKYLSDDEFKNVVGVLEATNRDTMFFDDIIIALRCTQNPSHIRQYLDMIIGVNASNFIINPNDSALNVKRLSRANGRSRSIIRQYIANNYKILMEYPYFTEIFNIMAEYVPSTHSHQFRSFHELISRELKLFSQTVEYNAPLIEPNSKDVGKQIKMTETFLDKFEPDIYNWLSKNQRPIYAASVAPNRNSAAPNRFGPALRLAGNLYRKLFKNTN